MAQFAYDETTGLEYILDENTGEWRPFIDADSGVEAALISAGGALNQIGRGIQDILGIDDREVLQGEQREQDALLAPLRQARPVSTFVGDVLPGVATAPVGGTAALAGRLGLGTSLSLSGGLGALEGLLRLDPNSVNQFQSTLLGGVGGLAGEGVGRMAGRVVNAIRGAGSQLLRSEGAEELAERGLQTLPSERLNVDGQNVAPLQRLEQGAQASLLSPRIFSEIPAERQALQNVTSARSIGVPDADQLTPDVLLQATDRLSDGFEAFAEDAAQATQGRAIPIDEDLATSIINTKGQVRTLFQRGMFRGLDPEVGGNALKPNELLIARRALAQDASNAASRGEYELAQQLGEDVNTLDAILEELIGADRVEQFTALRQQYRNLQILQGPGVINQSGDVSSRALARRLGQGTGYGQVYGQGRTEGLLPETAELFDVTRTLARPELQPFRSSGTAENLSLRDFGAAASGEPGALATQVAAPLLFNLSQGNNRMANVAGGLLLPGGPLFGRGGGELGPSLIDQLLMDQVNETQSPAGTR